MPLPAAFPLLAAAVSSMMQLFSGGKQWIDSNKVKTQDTRTDSLKEMTALARQQANSQLFPGQKAAESQINQNAANSASALMQSGTGASGILAGLSKLNQGTNQATNQLATQAAGFQSQQKDRLSNVLRQDAAWQQQDLQSAQKEKAALKQAGATNIFGGLSSAAGAAIYGMDAANNQVNADWMNTGLTQQTELPHTQPKNLFPGLQSMSPGYIPGYGNVMDMPKPAQHAAPGINNPFKRLNPMFWGQ